jgi:hypothetical protein
MKNRSTLALRIFIILVSIIVIALCAFVLPAGIMSDETDMYRPILLAMYLPAVPFFIAVYEAMKLLSYIDRNKVFSAPAIRSLQYIKYAAFVISLLYALGMPYIFYVADMDDAPGVVLIGFIFIFSSLVVGTAAGVFQKLLKNVVDMKSENELTV